ncbi:MAG: hypothetical protein JKY54_13445 [Flavobacteriales bacterium]|nr:hypothetical protein [Flavobacteriales bacterium]
MSIHHSNIIHSSGTNPSRNKRTGFVIRYIAAKAVTKDQKVVHICGEQLANEANYVTAMVNGSYENRVQQYCEFLKESAPKKFAVS